MDENTRDAPRLIELTESAAYDLASIDNATAATWGETQAERYQGFLREACSFLAAEPNLGAPILERPGLLLFVAKYTKRRNAHGHRVFYREIEGGIRIIRILHTAMNWPDVLGRDV